ncbi:MAG: GTP-binding protein [Bacillota bacterium]|nr:GTP-binding protein [Bacillota bacterium]
MLKYVVISGFLGAGKTSSMIAFSRYLQEKGKKAAVLVNDLGAKYLVDSSFTASAGCVSEEITGDCICYQTENLVDKLRRLRDLKEAEIVFSDIPGCGIGALDHVYHKLHRDYPGEFFLCPFVAVADPERLRVIMPEKANLNLPDEMAYLFDAQLREAEVILLNKTDRLTEKQCQAYMDFLKGSYPHARVFPVSAKSGQGIPEVVEYLCAHSSGLPVVDIGYGGPDFIAAEVKLSWYNRQFYVKARETAVFDGNAFVLEFIDSVRLRLASLKRNAPHLKVLGISEAEQMVKASLLGVDYETEMDRQLSAPCRQLRVVVNVRAACESFLLERVMDEAMKDMAGRYHLEAQVFFTECFGMMDEGRA